jgi:flagellar basal body-associated protein FliL
MPDINPNPKPKEKNSKGLLIVIVILLVVIVLVLVGVMVYPAVKEKLTVRKVEKGIDSDAYYAVFLSNGQVYFGHLAKVATDSPELTDIYYLQLKQQEQQPRVQPAEGEQPELQAQTEQQPELTLVKLGQELHGPEDLMVLNGDHILFYERLKDDSNVVKAIKEDKEKE